MNTDTSITLDSNGVYTFTGQSYADLTASATKSIIVAKSLGCDKSIQQQLQYSLIGSTFTCPTPTTQTPTNAVTDAPTPTSSTTIQTPTTQTPISSPGS